MGVLKMMKLNSMYTLIVSFIYLIARVSAAESAQDCPKICDLCEIQNPCVFSPPKLPRFSHNVIRSGQNGDDLTKVCIDWSRGRLQAFRTISIHAETLDANHQSSKISVKTSNGKKNCTVIVKTFLPAISA